MGALTIKPLAYKYRSWELTTIETLNFLDPLYSQITIQKRGNDIIRILPSRKENFYWITDKVRFLYEGLKKQRISFPYIVIHNKIIKINLNTLIILIKYLFYIIKWLEELSFLKNELFNKDYKILRTLLTTNLLQDIDLASQITLKFIFSKINIIKYEIQNYKGNRNTLYHQNSDLNFNNIKYIINYNVDLLNEFPRLWSLIKGIKHLNFGLVNQSLNSVCIDITNKNLIIIQRSKSFINFWLKDSIFFTKTEILGIPNQYILTKDHNSSFFDYKPDFNKTEPELFTLHFSNNYNKKENGIFFSFQTHGCVEKKTGVLLPITVPFEENGFQINNFGHFLQSNLVVIRKAGIRTILQYFLIIQNILEKKNRFSKVDFISYLKVLLNFYYGTIAEFLKKEIEFLKTPKIREYLFTLSFINKEPLYIKENWLLQLIKKQKNKINNFKK